MGTRKQRAVATKQAVIKRAPANPRALMTLTPIVGAATLASRFDVHPHGSDEGEFIADLAEELGRQCEQVKTGDLTRVESMLVSQAHSLNVLFTTLALKAHQNMGVHLDATDRYMRLAMRAQSQCRATLETLATIKNPPVVFAKQANIAHGHQQVNNGDVVPGARAGETGNRPNELLEAAHAKREWMDAGTARAAQTGDSSMATMEAIDRAKDRRR